MSTTFSEVKRIQTNNQSVIKIRDTDNRILWQKILELTTTTGDSLSVARGEIAAASNDNYALFIAGEYKTSATSGYASGAVDAYNKAFTHSIIQNVIGSESVATTLDNYILYHGYTQSTRTSGIIAFDLQLTRTMYDQSTHAPYYDGAAASNTSYALFTNARQIFAYDKSLTYSTTVSITDSAYGLSGTSLGEYIFFGGGLYCKTVHCYDSQLTRTLLEPRRNNDSFGVSSTSISEYAFFAGGRNSQNVDAYDSLLTRSTAQDLSVARYKFASTSIRDKALFYGGHSTSKSMEQYDSSLTRTVPLSLSEAKTLLAATSLGVYALFAGGIGPDSTTNYSTVEILHFG